MDKFKSGSASNIQADDTATLLILLKELDLSNTLGRQTQHLSNQDLLANLTHQKEEYRKKLHKSKIQVATLKPSAKTKTAQALQMTLLSTLESSKRAPKVDHTIRKFRTLAMTNKFDTSFGLSESLKKELYRSLGGDTSGQRIFNLGRELARDARPWKPGPSDRDFGNPSFDVCTESFLDVLQEHLHSVVANVEQEYKGLVKSSGATERERIRKSNVYASLHQLKETQEKVTKYIEQRKVDELRKQMCT